MNNLFDIKNQKALWIGLAMFLIGFPLGNMIGIVPDNMLNLWGRYFCFAIVAMGMNLLWGYTGVLSMCQAFFFCLGAYAIGMHMLLTTAELAGNKGGMPDFMIWNAVEELPFFWMPFSSFSMSLMLGLLIPGVAALLFGILVFRSRIKGVYFAIITQAFALAVWLLFLRNETNLGGTNGLTDFKTLLGFDLSSMGMKRALYIITVLVLVGTFFFSKWIVNSKLGRILIATRDSEFRLRFIGYDVWKYKVFVFVLAAVFAAIGGMLYVPQTGIITPGRMTVQASIEVVIWVALGGRATLFGPILGAMIVNLLYSWLTGALPGMWLFVLGGLFVVGVLFFPDGIWGLINKYKEKYASKKVITEGEA